MSGKRYSWLGISLAAVAMIIVLCLPVNIKFIRHAMLRATPPFDLKISFHNLSPSPDSLFIYDDPVINEQILNTLTRLNLRAITKGPEGYMGYTTVHPTSEVRILILAKEPVVVDAELALPTQGSIVYLLKDGAWKSYPSITSSAKQKIRIMCDSGQVKVDVTEIQSQQSFTFVPPRQIGE